MKVRKMGNRIENGQEPLRHKCYLLERVWYYGKSPGPVVRRPGFINQPCAFVPVISLQFSVSFPVKRIGLQASKIFSALTLGESIKRACINRREEKKDAPPHT